MLPRRKFLRAVAWMLVSASVVVLGQTSGQTKSSAVGAFNRQEYPVTFRQSVVAGKTPVGAKVEARLELATLVKGTVIPEGAIFSGEVIESAAKTAAEPSRLAIRMDSVQWKKGSASIKAYLTAWYYPPRLEAGELSADSGDVGLNPRATRDSTGSSPRFPPAPPSAPIPPLGVSDKRLVIKDVESTRQSDGVVTLSSKRMNIKLDRSITYVLAAEEPPAVK